MTAPHNTGLPEDAIVNTFSFIGVDPLDRAGVATQAKVLLDAFYGAIKTNLSSSINWAGNTLEFIDMADGKPRVPYSTTSVAFGTLTSSNYDMPSEVAICLSMRAATGSGLNAKRRRGRIYVGPLQGGALDQNSVLTAVVDQIAAAGAALRASATCKLAVYSPYTHHAVPVGENIRDYPLEVGALLDDSFNEVVLTWVDNAWDIQRRRGPKSTYRKNG